MSDRVFFDTNMLLYATHPTDPKGVIVRSLFSSLPGVISVQVLNEFVNVARRKLKRDWGEIEIALDSFVEIFPKPKGVTIDTHIMAVNISKRYGYSIFDGLILAAATESSCSVVYSEDMQDGQRIGAVTIKNPFVSNGR